MINLNDLRAALESSLAPDRVLPDHVAAFEAWCLAKSDQLADIAKQATSVDGQQRHPEHVAALGYAASMGLLSDKITLLGDDIEHLGGRQFFATGRPLRFEIDGIALLGVSLAVKTLGLGSPPWLAHLLSRSASELADDQWQSGLIRSAQICLGVDVQKIEPQDLGVVLAARGIFGIEKVNLDDAWHEASGLASPAQAPGRDAARLAAFNALLNRTRQIVPRAATLADVTAILRGVNRSLRRWTYEPKARTARATPVKWEVDNEYHVQDMLWVVLAPLFPDLEDEENLPSLGQKHPRADLGIPSLRTIIEVKYMRNAGQAALADVIEEVAADASLYRSKGSPYDTIIAFVWDDRAQTEQHHELQMGLEAIEGIAAAVIVPRPQKMLRAARAVAGEDG